jgi:hypothetical protein
MTVGPRIITDKSFIQTLNGDIIDEMTLYFTPTSLPTLISEIIADLKLPRKKDGRIAEVIVQQLAAKMGGAHGAQPPPLRSLVVGDLHGQTPPLNGYTLPVMNGTPGVASNASGTQLLVSQIPQQEMWARWEAGDFSTDDDATATAWRAAIAATDLEAERDRWKPFAEQLGNPNSLETAVEAVDRVMADPSRKVQADLINVALTAVRGDMRDKTSASNYFVGLPKGVLLRDYAPFAAHVSRLYLCFAVGLARGFIGTRPSNTIDLQYLLYAPFCRVLVSNDRLFRSLWQAGAVTSEGEFVWGEDFKADLKARNDWRRTLTFEQWQAHHAVHGQWPAPIEGSIVSRLWERHVPWWPRGGGSDGPNVGKHIDDIDDPLLKAAIAAMEKLRKQL